MTEWDPCPATPCWAMINYTDGQQLGDEAQAHYANFHGADCMTPEELIARAKELDANASKGPWGAEQDEDTWMLFGGGGMMALQLAKCAKRGTPYAEYWPTAADEAFIVESRTLLPLLVRELGRMGRKFFNALDIVRAKEEGLAEHRTEIANLAQLIEYMNARDKAHIEANMKLRADLSDALAALFIAQEALAGIDRFAVHLDSCRCSVDLCDCGLVLALAAKKTAADRLAVLLERWRE